MKREKKEIQIRRTAEGEPYQQDAERVAAAEGEGWEEYDRQGRPGLSAHGGWVARLVREVPAEDEHDDDTPEALASSESAESTTDTED